MPRRTVTSEHAHSEADEYNSWALYHDVARPELESHIAFYSALLQPETRAILELGCGTGLIINELRQKLLALVGDAALRFAGVDGSPGMLRQARKRNAHIEWHLADLRALPAVGEFDLAICCWNTFQHFDGPGLEAALCAARSAIRSGGTLAFDMYRPNFAYLEQPHRERTARIVNDGNGRPLRVHEAASYDGERRLLTLNWELEDICGVTAGPIARMTYRMWQHTTIEVTEKLKAAGFAIESIYGDFDRSQLDPDSRKQIFVCTAC